MSRNWPPSHIYLFTEFLRDVFMHDAALELYHTHLLSESALMWFRRLICFKHVPQLAESAGGLVVHTVGSNMLKRWGRCYVEHLEGWKEPLVPTSDSSSYFSVGGFKMKSVHSQAVETINAISRRDVEGDEWRNSFFSLIGWVHSEQHDASALLSWAADFPLMDTSTCVCFMWSELRCYLTAV